MSNAPAVLAGQSVVDDADYQYIQYEGSWTDQSLKSDGWNSNFYGRTYHSSTHDGETATLRWDGTAVKVLAATRKNAIVDGGEKKYFNTYSPDDGLNVTVFSVEGLDNGRHELKLINEVAYTNIPDRFVMGIDWFIVDGTPVDIGETDKTAEGAVGAVGTSTTASVTPSSSISTSVDTQTLEMVTASGVSSDNTQAVTSINNGPVRVAWSTAPNGPHVSPTTFSGDTLGTASSASSATVDISIHLLPLFCLLYLWVHA